MIDRSRFNLTEMRIDSLFVCLLGNNSDLFSCHKTIHFMSSSANRLDSTNDQCLLLCLIHVSFASCSVCSGIHHLARVGSTFHRLFALDHIYILLIDIAKKYIGKKITIHVLNQTGHEKSSKKDGYQKICKEKRKENISEKAILFLRCLQIQSTNRIFDLDIFIKNSYETII